MRRRQVGPLNHMLKGRCGQLVRCHCRLCQPARPKAKLVAGKLHSRRRLAPETTRVMQARRGDFCGRNPRRRPLSLGCALLPPTCRSRNSHRQQGPDTEWAVRSLTTRSGRKKLDDGSHSTHDSIWTGIFIDGRGQATYLSQCHLGPCARTNLLDPD